MFPHLWNIRGKEHVMQLMRCFSSFRHRVLVDTVHLAAKEAALMAGKLTVFYNTIYHLHLYWQALMLYVWGKGLWHICLALLIQILKLENFLHSVSLCVPRPPNSSFGSFGMDIELAYSAFTSLEMYVIPMLRSDASIDTSEVFNRVVCCQDLVD